MSDVTENLFNNCDGYKLLVLAVAIAGVLAESLSADDQNVLGNLLQAVGQNLQVIAAQNSKNQNIVDACNEKNKDNNKNENNNNEDENDKEKSKDDN